MKLASVPPAVVAALTIALCAACGTSAGPTPSTTTTASASASVTKGSVAGCRAEVAAGEAVRPDCLGLNASQIASAEALVPNPAPTPAASVLANIYTDMCTALGDGVSASVLASDADQTLKKDGTTGYTGAGLVTAAEKADCPQYEPQIVTYQVTGSSADVTYGPAGSTLTGSVPMKTTATLGDASYYAINAQLDGAGSVTVRILVDGVVTSTGTASGGYNIASAEIVDDDGTWTDANS